MFLPDEELGEAEMTPRFDTYRPYRTKDGAVTLMIVSDKDWAGDWVRAGYSRGVPMGGELTDDGRAPTFLISALKDPEGANLDRVQVVKGWIDGNGEAQERVYDVIWSDMDKRQISGGKVPAVGNSVNLADATADLSGKCWEFTNIAMKEMLVAYEQGVELSLARRVQPSLLEASPQDASQAVHCAGEKPAKVWSRASSNAL